MIELKDISKHYPPDVKALSRVNLKVEPGEFVSIVGQSGTGKTTLLRLLIGEERPTKGRIIIGGWDITDIRSNELPLLRRQIGVVFQDFKLLPKKTVFENVAFALEVSGASISKIQKIVPQVLKIVGLEKNHHKFPYQLSGGEKQRVVIARSLSHKPKILIADEPTGNLDSLNAQGIVTLLQKINSLGTTVLLVTHDREIVNSLQKRVIVLESGKISSDLAKGKYRI
ncbi:MAG: cell division ATP-binding protein FtsE [Patescibacteria group bacterium]